MLSNSAGTAAFPNTDGAPFATVWCRGSYAKHDPRTFRRSLDEVAKLLGQGQIRVHISHVYSLEEVRGAQSGSCRAHWSLNESKNSRLLQALFGTEVPVHCPCTGTRSLLCAAESAGGGQAAAVARATVHAHACGIMSSGALERRAAGRLQDAFSV